MRLLVTGATGFLGWRTATLLAQRGHDVTCVARPGHARRAAAAGLELVERDAGDPAIEAEVAGHDAVLHFAGVPDPARARADPATAVRENAGTTLNLLDACARHDAGLVYPSTVRAAVEPLPDAYAASKRLGEELCRHHGARASVVRLASVFGPGQVRAEGATGAIAAFAARALAGEQIVIPGNAQRTRDFVYVDDVVAGLEALVVAGDWGRTLAGASGEATALLRAAELVVEAAGTGVAIQTPGGELDPAENASYAGDPSAPRLGFEPRPLQAAISAYVDWLAQHPASQGGAQA